MTQNNKKEEVDGAFLPKRVYIEDENINTPKEEDNKCEKSGFDHAWFDSTPNIVYPTNPPQHPDKQETCKNCGLKRFHRRTIKEWIEYSDGKERNYEWENGSVTIVGNDTIGGGMNITFN